MDHCRWTTVSTLDMLAWDVAVENVWNLLLKCQF